MKRSKHNVIEWLASLLGCKKSRSSSLSAADSSVDALLLCTQKYRVDLGVKVLRPLHLNRPVHLNNNLERYIYFTEIGCEMIHHD